MQLKCSGLWKPEFENRNQTGLHFWNIPQISPIPHAKLEHSCTSIRQLQCYIEHDDGELSMDTAHNTYYLITILGWDAALKKVGKNTNSTCPPTMFNIDVLEHPKKTPKANIKLLEKGYIGRLHKLTKRKTLLTASQQFIIKHVSLFAIQMNLQNRLRQRREEINLSLTSKKLRNSTYTNTTTSHRTVPTTTEL